MVIENEPNYRKYFWPLFVSSTVFGIAGGLFPAYVGAIPGAVAGAIVACLWYRIMIRRAGDPKKNKDLGTAGAIWGAAMGIIATVLLHGSIAAYIYFASMPDQEYCPNFDLATFYLMLFLLYGTPIGFIAGGLLGAIFGTLFNRERRRARKAEIISPVIEIND